MNDVIAEMLAKALTAMANAYAPYSNFPVDACIRTKNGNLFAGCNVENMSYPLGNCAEATAIAAMVAAGYKEIAEIVIVAEKLIICPPCGGCRQRIAEFANKNTLIHLCSKTRVEKTINMQELLPLIFNLNTP